MTKTAIIGVDGATFRVLDRYRDELPTFSRFIDDGYSAKLISTDPPTTSVAWPSFATGCNPGRHGIYDFMNRDPETLDFELNDARKRLEGFFWQYMNESTGLASIPLIPYHRVDGFFFQGSLARINEDQITDPPSLSRKVPENYDYRIDWRDDNETILDGVKRRVDARGEFFTTLVGEYDLDFYFVMFNAIDHIQHHFWAYMDEDHPAFEPSEYDTAILDVHRRVDSAISDIVDALPPETNVLLVSDHGFMPNEVEVNLNTMLAREGYLEFEMDTSATVLTRVHKRAKQFLSYDQMTTLLPEWFQDAARSRMPINEEIGEAFVWESTRAYSFGVMPNIYLNIEGRERHGTVPEREYEPLLDKLEELFISIETPDGEQAFDGVWRGEDIYHGEFEHLAPDLVLVPGTGTYCKSDVGGQLFERKEEAMPNSGVHEREGILVADGPNVRPNDDRGRHDIVDVAPTVLQMNGYAAPGHFDGGPIERALVNGTGDLTAPRYGERSRIENRVLTLKQLEYI